MMDYERTHFEARCPLIMPQLNYNSSHRGSKRDPTNFILCQHFPTGWKYATGVIGKCLGHKTGSVD